MERSISLSREKWLDEALVALSESGHEALRAEPLAKRLSVSRGSFYWHFQDVPTFQRAVLDRWEHTAVDRPLERMASTSEAEGTELERLIDIAFTGMRKLERAVRGWAAVHAEAANTVTTVDRRRTLRLAAMFEQAGATPVKADSSATVLYWTYIGYILSADVSANKATVREVRDRLSGL